MKYLIFIFKHRFRRSSLNNILKCKKINQTYIIDLSGPFFYFFGKILYFFIRSKKVVFISCDGLDFLKRESNSINFWLGGTSEKILDKYRKFQNNFVAASTIFTDESKLLIFYPTLIIKNKFNSDFKFVYVSENVEVQNSKALKIWKDNKKIFLENLKLIDQVNFWANIVDLKKDPVQEIYKNIKSLIRNEMVHELNEILKEKFILIGSNWKKTYPSALESNYSNKYIENIYKGNICVDFGSKNSEKCIYPRTCKIIESGGLLFQSVHQDSKDIFKDLFTKTCFTSLQDMKEKIKFFLTNSDQLESLFLIQQKNFESDDLNYKTIKKIESFINR
tara:strand:+ start:2004 stop:3005 length:1002 start_codon:yes stop_codon:yes gene_type:complete